MYYMDSKYHNELVTVYFTRQLASLSHTATTASYTSIYIEPTTFLLSKQVGFLMLSQMSLFTCHPSLSHFFIVLLLLGIASRLLHRRSVALKCPPKLNPDS